jgi:hypothetical protein
MPDDIHADTLSEQARFVFRGTVQSVDASNMPEVVPASDRSAVVRVDQVLQSPQSLAQAGGQEVTLQFSEQPSLAPGDDAVFFTNPMAYGETIAAQAVGHRPAPATFAAMTRRADDPVQTLAGRDRQARIAAADLVIRGRVTSVGLTESTQAGRTLDRRDEHAPEWLDAVVEVLATEKGTSPGDQVIVRFPASRDIAWRDRPKFQAGDEGRFILNRWPTPRRRGRATDRDRPVYTAAGRYDFQPAHEVAGEGPASPVEAP